MTPRLNRATATAAGLGAAAAAPGPDALQIVHLGFGAFARAHTAVYTEVANRAEDGPHWEIVAVTQRSNTVVDELAPQDGLFTVFEEGEGAADPRLITCVREVLSGPDRPETVVERIADERTRVVALTITEKGYRADPGTGLVDLYDPLVRADLQNRAPTTAVGQIVRGLQRRAERGGTPITVVSCDNLPANGGLTSGVVRSFVQALPEEESAALLPWIEQNTAFPNTMVDRMVPQPTPQVRARVQGWLGAHDAGAVSCEPYKQWVIEDAFASERPAWDAAGAAFGGDVEAWEDTKLRVLNASHSLLAYLGLFAGYTSISETVGDEAFAGACRAMLSEEVLPTLDVPPGLDAEDYCVSVLHRFANPALGHTTEKVGSDGSQKLGPRLLSTARRCLDAGTEPRWTGLAVAAWIHHVVNGGATSQDEPLADMLRGLVREGAQAEDTVRAFLSCERVFDGTVGGDPRFGAAVTRWYTVLRSNDPAALREAVKQCRAVP